jgi:cytochrome P450
MDSTASHDQRSTPRGTEFNPLDPSFMASPAPFFQSAREQEPVFFAPAVNAWVITRYEDIDLILRTPNIFTSKDVISINDLLSPEVKEHLRGVVPMEGTLIGFDQPEHTKLRRVLSHAFTPSRITDQTAPIANTIHRMLDVIKDDHEADLLSALCYPLPLDTISQLIGFPPEDASFSRQVVEDWAELSVAFLRGVSLPDQMVLAERIVRGHLNILELFEQRRAAPKEDLLSAIVARQEADNLTAYEMLSLVPGLFLAGHETTANALATGLYHLLSERSRWEALIADLSTVDNVVEELLRIDDPVFGMWRNVAEDVEIAGVSIPKGDRLYLSFWSANLDPARFPLQSEFEPSLATRQHLAFGRGIHLCIGAPLARLEMRTTLTILAQEFPTLALKENFEPEWKPHFFIRGMAELPVTW